LLKSKASLKMWKASFVFVNSNSLSSRRTSHEARLKQKLSQLSLGVSICLNLISIETRSRQLQKVSPDSVKIYVSTIKKSRLRRQKSESRQLKNVGLDVSRNLDLDWSRLSRPPGLKIGLKHAFKGDLSDNKNLTCRSCE
jgi:hypothetical protein